MLNKFPDCFDKHMNAFLRGYTPYEQKSWLKRILLFFTFFYYAKFLMVYTVVNGLYFLFKLWKFNFNPAILDADRQDGATKTSPNQYAWAVPRIEWSRHSPLRSVIATGSGSHGLRQP